MMIASLSCSQDLFPIGTISAIANLAIQIGMQCVLEIKDRNASRDREIVSLVLFECFNDSKLYSESCMVYMYLFTNTTYVTSSESIRKNSSNISFNPKATIRKKIMFTLLKI